jgi:hypothetical protein
LGLGLGSRMGLGPRLVRALWSYYYPGYYPPYYPPAAAVAPSEPPQYVEQGNVSNHGAPGDANAWWYHCSRPEGYYPYVKDCPGGWQRVPPQQPSSSNPSNPGVSS